jgi:hypothetical protein
LCLTSHVFILIFSNITYYIIVPLTISSFSKFTIIMSPKLRLGFAPFIIIMASKRSLWDILLLLCFLLLLLFLLFHFLHNFVRHFSRRFLDQTLWNLVLISYCMWSCAFKCWFFQNGFRCHGNVQNAKILKKHKHNHSRLHAKQKLMKLDRNNIHI